MRASARPRALGALTILAALLAVGGGTSGTEPSPQAGLWCTRELPCSPGSGHTGWCLYGGQVLRCR